MNRFQDKVVIITGGASGLGKAAALKFGQEGAKVIIWDLNKDKCLETKKLLESKNYSCDIFMLNTAAFPEVKKATKQVFDKYGKIDVLINNAGITRDATIHKMSSDQWQQVIDVNLTGVFNCSKAVTPFMQEAKSGRIINTSSVVGLYGNFGQVNYVASKAGVIGMTKTLAKELGKFNITVNAVAPGFIETDMVKTIPEKVLQMVKEKTPLNKLGKPDDIANAYAFLASADASFISGTTLSVDGAITL